MACQSAAKAVADIFKESDKIASALGCAVATGVGAVVGVPIDYGMCLSSVQKAVDFTKEMIDFWNDMLGSDSWSTIGPRQLLPNEEFKGTLWSTGGRMYITPFPLGKDIAKLIITERDGKAKTSIEVCKFNQAGKSTELATRWFNDTNDRQDQTKEQRIIELDGVKNHVLVVHFDAKSVTNKFAYSIKLVV
jgi:hypothetical protein